MPTLSGPEYLNGQFSVAADGTVSLTTPPLSTAGGTISPGPVIIRNTAAAPQPFTSPLLHVATEAGNANLVIDNYTAANLPVLWLRRARGTAAVPATVQSGDALGAILGQAYDSAGPGYYTPARIDFTALQNMSSSSQGTAINFINSGTDASFLVRRMQIARGVVIGNPAPDPGQGGLVLNANAATPQATTLGPQLWLSQADGVQGNVLNDAYGGVTANFVGRLAGGTAAAPTALGNGAVILSLTAQGRGATSYGFAGSVSVRTAEAWSDTARGSFIRFDTTSPTTTVAAAKAWIVDGVVVPGSGGTPPAGGLSGFGDMGPGTVNVAAGYYLNGQNIHTQKAFGGNGSANSYTTMTSATAIMFGAGCVITPRVGSVIQVMMIGRFGNNSPSATVQLIMQLCWGTGTAPSQGAAQTGTPIGLNQFWALPGTSTAALNVPFIVAACILPGATPVGTPIWIDVQVSNAAAGQSAFLGNCVMTAIET